MKLEKLKDYALGIGSFAVVLTGFSIFGGMVYEAYDKSVNKHVEYISEDSLALKTNADSTAVYKMLPDSTYSLLGSVANENVSIKHALFKDSIDRTSIKYTEYKGVSELSIMLDMTPQYNERIKELEGEQE